MKKLLVLYLLALYFLIASYSDFRAGLLSLWDLLRRLL